MPFYEYECANCKFYTEVMQRLSDAPLKKCPSCGKSTMKKLISAPVFRLKGGGWYETDFKSDNESKRNLAGEGSAAADAKARDTAAPADTKAADSKSEAKPAEKSAASEPGTASRSASKGTGVKAAKPAAKAPARKPAPKAKPKPKAKASKRRGR